MEVAAHARDQPFVETEEEMARMSITVVVMLTFDKSLNLHVACSAATREASRLKKKGRDSDLMSDSGDLNFSNEDKDSGCRSCADGEGGSVLQSFVKKVFGKGNPEAGMESIIGDHGYVVEGLWPPGTPGLTRGMPRRGLLAYISIVKSAVYEYDKMHETSNGDSFQLGKGSRVFKPELVGVVPQEDEISPCSSASSTTHSMKMESNDPWLVSGGDRDDGTPCPCNNQPSNYLLQVSCKRIFSSILQIRALTPLGEKLD